MVLPTATVMKILTLLLVASTSHSQSGGGFSKKKRLPSVWNEADASARRRRSRRLGPSYTDIAQTLVDAFPAGACGKTSDGGIGVTFACEDGERTVGFKLNVTADGVEQLGMFVFQDSSLWTVQIDFPTSSCSATSGGEPCTTCNLCDISSSEIGVSAKCGDFSPYKEEFAGVSCVSIEQIVVDPYADGGDDEGADDDQNGDDGYGDDGSDSGGYQGPPYEELSNDLQAAFNLSKCSVTSVAETSTGVTGDGTTVESTYTSLVTNCSEPGRWATLKMIRFEDDQSYGGTLEIGFDSLWSLYVDLSSSSCSIETSSGDDSACDCEMCQTDDVDLGVLGSCAMPFASNDPFVDVCIGVTSLALGVASGSGHMSADDKFGLTFDIIKTILQTAFSVDNCAEVAAGSYSNASTAVVSNDTAVTTEGTTELNCLASGRSAYLSKLVVDGNEDLGTLIIILNGGKFTLNVDFYNSTCTASNAGVTCGCELCSNARDEFGASISCPVASSSTSSNASTTFSGSCISVKDLAEDGTPTSTPYDIIANDLIETFTAENCDASQASSESDDLLVLNDNATQGSAVTIEYELSCAGVGQSASLTASETNGVVVLEQLTISANDAWFVFVDYASNTCSVDVGESQCSSCTNCRTADDHYGIMVTCPENTSLNISVFSSTDCVNVAQLAQESGNYQDRSEISMVTDSIESAFPAGSCSKSNDGGLHCLASDGHSATVDVTKVNATTVVSMVNISIPGPEGFAIISDFAKPECIVHLANDDECGCDKCFTSEGEFGFIPNCASSLSNDIRLTGDSCVVMSAFVVVDESVNQSATVKLTFDALVSSLKEAFPNGTCIMNTTNESYTNVLANGTQVESTQSFYAMNCSFENRTAYVSKTDNDGGERLGSLYIRTMDIVSFDFESGQCSVTANNFACVNCSTCFADGTEPGIIAVCPDAFSSSSVFSDPNKCVTVTDVTGGAYAGEETNSGAGVGANSTTVTATAGNTTRGSNTNSSGTPVEGGGSDGDVGNSGGDQFGGTTTSAGSTQPRLVRLLIVSLSVLAAFVALT